MSVSIISSHKQKSALLKLNTFFDQLQLRMDKHHQRKQLAQLSIEQLTDMGIDPADAQKEIGKPFWK